MISLDYKSKNSILNDTLFEMMKKAYDRKSLMASAINTTSNYQVEEKVKNDLSDLNKILFYTSYIIFVARLRIS